MGAFWSGTDRQDQTHKPNTMHMVFGLHDGHVAKTLCTVFFTGKDYDVPFTDIVEEVDFAEDNEPVPEWVSIIEKQSYKVPTITFPQADEKYTPWKKTKDDQRAFYPMFRERDPDDDTKAVSDTGDQFLARSVIAAMADELGPDILLTTVLEELDDQCDLHYGVADMQHPILGEEIRSDPAGWLGDVLSIVSQLDRDKDKEKCLELILEFLKILADEVPVQELRGFPEDKL